MYNNGIPDHDQDIRKTKRSSKQAELQLTRITINNKDLSDKTLEMYNSGHVTKTLKMKFTDKNISFKFDGIYMTNPGSLRYSYFLEGFSTEWSTPNNNSIVSFTNLPPGEYIFKLKIDTGKI